MTATSETILITTLAEYQTRFWIPVAERLRSQGREVQLLAFDDRSAEMAATQGIPVVNMYRSGLQQGVPVDDHGAFTARIADYGLDGTNFLFSHERVTFGIRDTAALRRRFTIYSNAMEALLDRLAAAGRQAVAVQELGGFLSVIACFYAARKRGIRNWFIEPSFFRGRLYYTPDSLAAPDTMRTRGGRGVDRRARLSRRNLAAAIDRHPAKGPSPIFGGVQQDRQREERAPPRRKTLGPVRTRQAPGVRAQPPPCPARMPPWRSARRGCGNSIVRCRTGRSSITRCTSRPTWR